MIAHLYIVAESFANNANFTTAEIENKIKSLAEDFVYIKKFKETNKLYVHHDIYNINFLNEISLSDLIDNWQTAKEYIDRDVFNALQKIIIESKTTDYTSQEVMKVLLPEHNDNICHGLIAFNPIPSVQIELQIVYNLQGWLEFRRYFLGLYPKDADFFMKECEKYFPDILFHGDNRKTVKHILPDFSVKVVSHLTALNDKFRESQDGIRNRQQVLDHFSLNCRLDKKASLEGKASKKNHFTYEFQSSTGSTKNVCCEPHLKLCSSGKSGDNSYHHHRIYFHEGFPDFDNGKILVGRIGKHIKFD